MTLPAVFTDLTRKLDYAEPSLRRLENYYQGNHPLSFATGKFREAFGQLFHALSSNWMPLIIEAVESRLSVEAFRFGDSEDADADAWSIWQRNGMDARSSLAHTESLVFGRAFASVWAAPDGSPRIAVESARQCVVARDPANPRQRLAALKRWVDNDSHAYATLYEPDVITRYRSARPVAGAGMMAPTSGEWPAGAMVTATDWTVREVVRNPLNVVPVVELVNRPSLLGDGESEFAGVTGLQDACNKLLADMLLSSEMGAFRQRWATGLDVPTDPATNAPIEPFSSAVTRLWVAEDETTSFGEFGATDLQNYTRALETIVEHIASQSRTPSHFLSPSADRLSGESIKSSESGLVSKVRRKQVVFGEAWEECVRLCFAVLGDPRAHATSAETVWSDPEIRSDAELADALLKRQAIGVPREQLWQDAGYSPQQIARFASMTPPPPPPGGNQP